MKPRYQEKDFEERIPLLREYGELLCGSRQRFSEIISEYHSTTDENAGEKMTALEARLYNTIFLVDFTFKQIYGIKTYEEACARLEEDRTLLSKTHLDVLIDSKYIFLPNGRGIHTFKSVRFVLWLVYENLDPMRDVICCYDWFISNDFKGRHLLMDEREYIKKLIAKNAPKKITT